MINAQLLSILFGAYDVKSDFILIAPIKWHIEKLKVGMDFWQS